MNKNIILILIFSTVIRFGSLAQTYDDMYHKALNYRDNFKYVEALAYFQVLLKTDSANLSYLTNTSLLLSKVGYLQPDEKKKFECFHVAEYLAKKAIATDTRNGSAHYAYALALARLNENAGTKQKVANAKLIKSEAETCLKYNPEHPGAYHVLGRWNRTVAGFGSIEKLAVNALYGGMPSGGSYDESIDAFKKAIKYEPNYILHYYELALSYLEKDGSKSGKESAKFYLKKLLTLPNQTPDDPDTKRKSDALLKKLGN